MDDSKKAAYGCLITVMLAVIGIACSVAIGIFFGVGWAFVAFAAFAFLALIAFVSAFRRNLRGDK